MHKQHLQTACRKYAVLRGIICENCDRSETQNAAAGHPAAAFSLKIEQGISGTLLCQKFLRVVKLV